MIKTFIYKFLISFCVIIAISQFSQANEAKFVSLSPALTEVMYEIGAENQLIGVSTECSYPTQARSKEIIGNNYFINKEKILKLKPNYILAIEGSQYTTANMSKIGIEPLYFNLNSVNSILNTIIYLGKLTGNEINAQNTAKKISQNIDNVKTTKPKRILYLIQLQPFITIGNKSFIADLIRKSGQISVTENLDSLYPSVSTEYILKTNPDIIVLSFRSDDKILKTIFPHKKIIYLTKEQNDIINRPGPRIVNAVKFFSNL